MNREIHAVTGAFGFSGKYITRRLLAKGKRVITLTNAPPHRNPFGEEVQAFPFDFERCERLVERLKEVSVLYNTYWVRFNHPRFNFEGAVKNVQTLFEAARTAGVGHVVHISITNPSLDSPLEYFSGKARLEQALQATGLPHTILRPAVLFGDEDILINNIAWTLRHLPVFGVFGDGRYRIQPIFVDDLAGLAVEAADKRVNQIIDAIGPQTFTYRDLVGTIGRIIGKTRPIVSVPPGFGYRVGAIIGRLVGDVLITRDEIEGLMADLLYVQSPPAGSTRLTQWARRHSATLGVRYASELARRVGRP